MTIASCALVAGCATPLERPMQLRVGSHSRALATPADVRIITDRERPSPSSRVMCAEPSPDVAKALSTLLQLSGQAKTKAGVEAGAGLGASTAESVSLLAGRTASVVALRDGLFRACESYANGTLRRDAYSLILSQYGDLLVTMTLGEAVASANAIAAAHLGGTPTAPKVEIQFPGLSGNGGGGTGAGGTGGSGGGGTGGSGAGGGTTNDGAADTATADAGSATAVAKIAELYFSSAKERHIKALITMCVNRAGDFSESNPFLDQVCPILVKQLPDILSR
jgi:hypothetical protein